MAVELLFHRVPVSAQDDFANSEPSLLSNLCQGIFMLMHGWYPTTTDTSEQHRTMSERDVLTLTPLGLTAITHYWSFGYITPLADHREARNPNFNDAPHLIQRHEGSLQREAGALTFYHRAITGYLDTLQKPLAQIDHRITELARENPGSELLPRAKEERTSAVMQLKEQLGNFESFDSASFIALFEQMILQAVKIKTPLQQNGKPSDELPLGLHGIVEELERIQKIEDPAMQQKAVEAAASELHQGSPLCVQPLSKIWKRYLRTPDFISLKTKILAYD